MSALLELAQRCESATGPDRELDAEIGRYAASGFLGYVPAEPQHGCAAFTTSLDAAMTLVPEAHTLQLSDWDHEILRAKGPWQAIILPMGARGGLTNLTFTNRCDHAASAALALCAAALRARASQGDAK